MNDVTRKVKGADCGVICGISTIFSDLGVWAFQALGYIRQCYVNHIQSCAYPNNLMQGISLICRSLKHGTFKRGKICKDMQDIQNIQDIQDIQDMHAGMRQDMLNYAE